MSHRVKPKKPKKPRLKNTKANGAGTAAQARAMLRKADEVRVSACAASVDAVLKKFNCRLQGVPAFVPAGQGSFNVGIKVQIVTIDEEAPASG